MYILFRKNLQQYRSLTCSSFVYASGLKGHAEDYLDIDWFRQIMKVSLVLNCFGIGLLKCIFPLYVYHLSVYSQYFKMFQIF